MQNQWNSKEFISSLVGKNVKVIKQNEICSLWAGYGSIKSLTILTDDTNTIQLICKIINPPKSGSGISHERKVKSYIAETFFYSNISKNLKFAGVPIATSLFQKSETDGSAMIIMDDLRVEYPIPGEKGALSVAKMCGAVDWLARFHAYNWESGSWVESSLWAEGCYWRLDTRKDEWDAIGSDWKRLKNAARAIADLLRDGIERGNPDRFKTLVHGDFKAPNIMFKSENDRFNLGSGAFEYTPCAAVDFQYCGGGYGARDVVKLVVSSVCMEDDGLKTEEYVLKTYYQLLMKYLLEFQYGGDEEKLKSLKYSFDKLVQHYELCLLDYVRFMEGWGTWGNVEYAEHRAKDILNIIDQGNCLSPEEYEIKFRSKYHV